MQPYTFPRAQKFPGIRDRSGHIKFSSVLLLAVYVTLATIYIPTALFTNLLTPSLDYFLSIAMPLAGIGLCIVITVSPKPIIPFCFIAGFIVLFGINLTLSAVLCVFFLLSVLYAYLLHERLWLVALSSNVISLAALFFLFHSIPFLFVSLAFLPAAVMLFWSFKKKKQRVPTLVSISSAMALTLIVALLVFIYVNYGSLTTDTIKNFFDSLRTDVTSSISSTLTTNLAGFEDNMTPKDAVSFATSMITLTFNMLPATLAIIFFVISFVMHSLFVSILSVTTKDKQEIANAVTFGMSVTSAVIFIISYILALTLSTDGISVYSMAAQNIYTMLFPGFTLVTFGFFGGLLKSGKGSCLGTLIYFAMFVLLFALTDVLLVIASFVGAVLVIISAIKSKGKK